MRKPNKLLALGVFIVGMSLSLKHFGIHISEFVESVILGLGIGLELLGLYSAKHDISKLRERKLKFIKKLLGHQAA